MAKSAKTKKISKKSVHSKSPSIAMPKISLFWLVFFLMIVGIVSVLISVNSNHQRAMANQQLQHFKAKPFNRVRILARPRAIPGGMSPVNIKQAYGLQRAGNGSGTIAIVDAYDDPSIEPDLGVFSRQYSLPSCTTLNGCFEKHKCQYINQHDPNNCNNEGSGTRIRGIMTSSDWALEIALDVQWAHAIAPSAKILLIEARSSSGNDLLNAVDYARGRSEVVAVSMSWGGDEFSGEGLFENHFVSNFGATFFASSGDNGHGVSWPAVSSNVVGVGGTTVTLSNGSLSSETAWSGSGGGLSAYLSEPSYQASYAVPNASSKRAVPDVSYDADPATGFPVYDSVRYFGSRGWFMVGGTSAGAPQWAAIRSITAGVNAANLYQDAATPGQTKIGDIISGSNGSCGATFCAANTGYDYVTGLGSPRGASF